MATGATTTTALADSLPVVIDSARAVREYEGVYSRTCEMHRLPAGTGLDWDEITLNQLTAQAITENTVLDNPQQLADTKLTITPTQVGIQVRWTDKAKNRISPTVLAKTGMLAQNAMDRKKEQDYYTVLDGLTNSQPGAGSTLTSGVISAARSRIMGNATEPAQGQVCTVLHPYQIKDIQDEIVAGIGTYTVPSGMTEETFRRGFQGTLFGTTVYEAGLIPVDSADDAKGGVHAKMGIICVQGMAPTAKTKDRPEIGGGAEDMFLYDDYAFGERLAAGTTSTFGVEIYSDALTPTV